MSRVGIIGIGHGEFGRRSDATVQELAFEAYRDAITDGQIDPKDIDHIEILKGAAAAAIYGSRASNGVVQIFTKRGVVGKPKITFSFTRKST